MNRVVRSFWLFGLVVCGASLANAREWTINGTAKVEAEFSGIIGDTVFLSKMDGSEQKVSLASLSAEDQAFINSREQATTSVVSASPPPASAAHKSGYSVIANLLTGKLVAPGENGFIDYTPTNPAPDYYAIYFSAGWCGPCHHFTPKLVNFYQQMKPAHNNFEVIFVSRDRSAPAMLDYMRQFSMPWPALRFAEIKGLPDITKYAGRGIPCLVIVDAQGDVVADSYENGQYVGAVKPMDRLGKLLQTGP